MPQNHRTFLSVHSIAHLPHLYLLFTNSIFLFSLPSPLVSPVHLHSIFLVLFLCLCKTSPQAIHHHLSHPHLVLFLLLLTCFHSPSCSRSIIRAPTSVVICHWFSFTHSCITPSGVPLSPVLFDIPGGLYFIQPTRPQVGIAVLVRAGVWVKAVWDSLL